MHFASGYKRINQARSIFATITWFSVPEERTRLSAGGWGGGVGIERSLEEVKVCFKSKGM